MKSTIGPVLACLVAAHQLPHGRHRCTDVWRTANTLIGLYSRNHRTSNWLLKQGFRGWTVVKGKRLVEGLNNTGHWSKLRPRERRGSRARCVLLTDGTDEAVASRLTAIVAPFATISANDVWMPRGFADPRETRIGEALNLLEESHRGTLRNWWLAVNHPLANTPNWDVASTATVDGKKGMVLVEAKAHVAELSSLGKPVTATTNAENHARTKAVVLKQAVL